MCYFFCQKNPEISGFFLSVFQKFLFALFVELGDAGPVMFVGCVLTLSFWFFGFFGCLK